MPVYCRGVTQSQTPHAGARLNMTCSCSNKKSELRSSSSICACGHQTHEHDDEEVTFSSSSSSSESASVLSDRLTANPPPGRRSGRTLTLPNNAHFNGSFSLGSTVYIRAMDESLCDRIFQLRMENRMRIRVIGTPGTGKSSGLCSRLLHRLRLEFPQSIVIYVDFKRPCDQYMRFCVVRGVHVANSLSSFVEDVNKSSTFVVYDMGSNGPQVPASGWSCTVIVLSSPNQRSLRDFSRVHSAKLVSTCWDEFEIEESYRHVFKQRAIDWAMKAARDQAELTAAKAGQDCHSIIAAGEKAALTVAANPPTFFADYKKRFLEFGGLPSYVFNHESDRCSLQKEFINSLPSAKDIMELMMLKDKTNITVDRGDHLIAFEVDSNFKVVQTRWVSDTIAGWAVAEVYSNVTERFTIQFLNWMAENRSASEFFDIFFEEWARMKLAQGGTFAIQRMDGTSAGNIVITPSQIYYYDERNIQNMPLETYGRPTSQTAESVDSIYQPSLIFQWAPSNDQEINVEGLEAVIRKPGESEGYLTDAQHAMLIVVPETRFHSFKQVILNPSGSRWPPSIGDRVFKLRLPSAAGRTRTHETRVDSAGGSSFENSEGGSPSWYPCDPVCCCAIASGLIRYSEACDRWNAESHSMCLINLEAEQKPESLVDHTNSLKARPEAHSIL